MKRTVITALISLIIPLLCLAQQTNTPSGSNPGKPPVMVTRSYDVLPTIVDKVGSTGTLMVVSMVPEPPDHHDLRTEYFREMGVEWPEGSSLKYIAAIGKLVVTNTEENMRKFEEVLSTLNVVPNQIEVEVKFIEYQLSDIEALAKHGGATQEALMSLWQKGQARLIHAPKVVTQCGIEATVKSVKEIIYPSDLSAQSATGAIINANMTNSIASAQRGFTTREVGVILKVLPEVSTEGWINLQFTPVMVEEPTWKTYKANFTDKDGKLQQAEIEEPFFFTRCFTTGISVKNGKTVMAGGGMMNRTNDKMVYCFVTARIVNIEGKPISSPDSADSESQKGGNK
jgi:type II secretory pathway component GspD/PulD (secretin)